VANAYLPGYEWDLFISYATVDNRPPPGVEKGWVTTLVAALETTINQKLGRNEACKIWRDEEQRSADSQLSEALADAVRSSAILLIILSPGYLASTQWCAKELETYCERAAAGRPVKIFVIERDPDIGEQARPAILEGAWRRLFWRKEGGKTRILGNPTPTQEFYKEAYDIAVEIAQAIGKLKSAASVTPASATAPGLAPAPAPAPIGAASAGKTIYLATPTEDLLDGDWRQALNHFKQFGLTVLPGEEDAVEAAKVEANVARDLPQAKMFVQLLSEVAGRDVPGRKGMSYVRYQCEQASQQTLTMLQWRRETLDVEKVANEEHKALLLQAQAVPLTTFLQEVVTKATAVESASVVRTAQDVPLVLINADKDDEALARQVMSDLGGRIEVTLLDAADPPDQRQALLKGYLELCDRVLLLYGKTTPTWLRLQHLEFRKWSDPSKPRPLVICDLPPANKPRPVSGPGITYVGNGGDYDPDALRTAFSKAGA
jgi:hypothetical protein